MLRQKVQPEIWDRLVRERVGEPLRPERLGSLLVVVPAASGDVALATTVIRHVKNANPDCRVSFATRRANIPLIKMCPGVSDVVEVPHETSPLGGHQWDALSRRSLLKTYAGRADAVVSTCFFPEDVGLLTEHHLNALEAIWLLTGVPGGMPREPQRVWLQSPLAPAEAPAVIRRSLGRPARAELVSRGLRRLPESLGAVVRARSLKGSRIKTVPADLYRVSRSLIETARPMHRRRLNGDSLDRDFVILSTEATSLPAPPRGVVGALVRMLQKDGRTVLHNVRDPLHAAPGAAPLVCTYPEFVCLREAGVPFVGWRNGLCDIAAAAPAPMCVFSPPEHDWHRDVQAMFGFGAMNVAVDCLEVVCRDVSDVKRSNFVNHLKQRIQE